MSEVVPLTGLRKTIADRMSMSVSTMAQVTLTTEVDVTELLNLRELLVSEWRPHRLRPLDLDIIIAAVADALKAHPRMNSHLVDGEVRLLKDVNIGVAVAVPDGLVVPVLRGADSLDLLGVAQGMRSLADKTRKGQLGLDDVTGAGFTVTALSNYEIDAFTPIIDPPAGRDTGTWPHTAETRRPAGRDRRPLDDAPERDIRPPRTRRSTRSQSSCAPSAPRLESPDSLAAGSEEG